MRGRGRNFTQRPTNIITGPNDHREQKKQDCEFLVIKKALFLSPEGYENPKEENALQPCYTSTAAISHQALHKQLTVVTRHQDIIGVGSR